MADFGIVSEIHVHIMHDIIYNNEITGLSLNLLKLLSHYIIIYIIALGKANNATQHIYQHMCLKTSMLFTTY